MSHELRTPLNAIGGFARAGGDGDPRPRHRGTARGDLAASSAASVTSSASSTTSSTSRSSPRAGWSITSRICRSRCVIDALEPLVSSQLAAKSLRYVRQDCDERVWVRADARQAAPDHAQPAVERDQVHGRGRPRRRRAAARRATSCASSSRTRASGFPPSGSRRSSSRSCRWDAASTRTTRARGSASRSAATSRGRCMAT